MGCLAHKCKRRVRHMHGIDSRVFHPCAVVQAASKNVLHVDRVCGRQRTLLMKMRSYGLPDYTVLMPLYAV